MAAAPTVHPKGRGGEGVGKIVATFRDRDRAEAAIRELEEKGYTDREISLVTKDRRGRENLANGTAWGAGIGAGAGLLASAGLLAIPGIGPLLAAGPLAATLGGATVGGLAGAFVDWGLPDQEGRHLEEEIREGRSVVLIRSDHAEEAKEILRRRGADELDVVS
jgi:uncharacterized membrane protein